MHNQIRRAVVQLITLPSMAALACSAAYAQDGRRDTPTAIPAPETTTGGGGSALEEILVTAQRRSQRQIDVPLSLTTQGAEDLEKAGVTNIGDLTAVVPGLNYTALAVYANPSIRGINTSLTQAGAESPVAIYLDGFYQPNQIGNFFDLPDVERIEVLKGPQGTLFGRNATGGAVSIYTKEPSFTPTARIVVSDGMYFGGSAKTANEISAKGFLSGPLIDDLLAASISAYYKHGDGYMTDLTNGKRTGESESHLLRGKILFQPTDWARFTLSAMYSEHDERASAANIPLGGNTASRFYPGAIIPTEPWTVASELKDGPYVETEHRAITLRGEFDIEDFGTLTSLTGYTEVDGYLLMDVDGGYAPDCLAAFVCNTPYLVKYGPTETFQQELTFASRKFGAFSFIGGLFFYRDDHNYSSEVNSSLSPSGEVDGISRGIFYTDAVAKTKAHAAFGEVSWDVTDRLNIIAGIRYSWEEKSVYGSMYDFPPSDLAGSPDWDSWTPRLSLIYKLAHETNLYATYSEGFKSGVIESISMTGDIAEPEDVKAYEVGIKIRRPSYVLDMAAYYYDYTDLQIQYYDGLRTILNNAATAEIYGFELEGTAIFGNNFEVRLASSWIPGAKYKSYTNGIAYELPNSAAGMIPLVVDATGDRMMKTPEFTGSVSLRYTREMSRGDLAASSTIYHSTDWKWELLNRVKADAYTTVAAEVRFIPRDGRTQYSLWGKNLTNEDYLMGSAVNGLADTGVYAPPRQVGLSFEYSF